MDILVYGAGVIGSVYAARLQAAGQNVTLLARGSRAESLRNHGIQLEDMATGRRTATRVSVVEQLNPDDRYDVVIITVRLDQLPSVLPILAANRHVPTLLFMVSNPVGKSQYELLDVQRVVAGFPAAGGARQGDIVRYLPISQVSTMIGEVDGQITPRLRELAAIFKQAGFKVKLSSNMLTWLKTHAIADIGIITSANLAGGSGQLARSRSGVMLLVQSIREGLLALKALGMPLTPLYLIVLFLWLPRWLSVTFLQMVLRTRISALGIDVHLGDDLGEMRQMARDTMALLRTSPYATPSLNRLAQVLEQTENNGKIQVTTNFKK